MGVDDKKAGTDGGDKGFALGFEIPRPTHDDESAAVLDVEVPRKTVGRNLAQDRIRLEIDNGKTAVLVEDVEELAVAADDVGFYDLPGLSAAAVASSSMEAFASGRAVRSATIV